MDSKKIGMKIGESIFSISYLLFALIAGLIFLKHNSNKLFLLYGIMTLILCFGDAFHLIPRVLKNIKGENDNIKWWMNFGLIVTSITMTIFYLILFYIWKIQNNNNIANIIPVIIWVLALIRIIICLLHKNNWFNGGNKNMSLFRNIVFLIIGLIEVILFLILGGTYGIVNAICILLSFIFYLPVALFAKNNPKLGMLMFPKTIMYIIIIGLGLSLL